MKKSLYVDHEKLGELSKYFLDKSEEMEKLLKKMNITISAIRASWNGDDSEAFIKNATSYVKNLAKFQENLNDYGIEAGSKESGYNTVLQNYFDKLKRL